MHIEYTFVERDVEGERFENAWRAGAKRRCQPKLERLVRVLFGSHLRGRGIQTVRSISPSEERDSRDTGKEEEGGGQGRRGTTAATRRKLLLLLSVYPYDSAANQRIRSSGSRRLSACPPEAEAIRFRRFHNRGARGVSQRQRLTNRWRLSATRAEFREIVSPLYSLSLSLSPPFSLSVCLSLSL